MDRLEVAERVVSIAGSVLFIGVILMVALKIRRNPDEMRWRS